MVSCWITHAQFPLRPCKDMSSDGQLACTALHTISCSFVGWLSLTLFAIIMSSSCSCMPMRAQRLLFMQAQRLAQRAHPPAAMAEEQRAGGDYTPARALRTSALPGTSLHNLHNLSVSGPLFALQAPLRHRINQVLALPTTPEPPLDGDVCGVCLEGDVAKVYVLVSLCPTIHSIHTHTYRYIKVSGHC